MNLPDVDIVHFLMNDGAVFSGSVPAELPTHKIMKSHLKSFQEAQEGTRTQLTQGQFHPFRQAITFTETH